MSDMGLKKLAEGGRLRKEIERSVIHMINAARIVGIQIMPSPHLDNGRSMLLTSPELFNKLLEEEGGTPEKKPPTLELSEIFEHDLSTPWDIPISSYPKTFKTTEPPEVFLKDPTGSRQSAFRWAYRKVEGECDQIQEELSEMGLEPVEVSNTIAHGLMNALARHCFITATLDGRKPDREWFLYNCATHFDKYVAVQDEEESDG